MMNFAFKMMNSALMNSTQQVDLHRWATITFAHEETARKASREKVPAPYSHSAVVIGCLAAVRRLFV